MVQQHWIPDGNGGYTVHQQNYSYDSLNRISWVGEYLNGAQNTGSQSYSYDRYGNRTLSGAGTGINNQQFSVDTNTNRLGVPLGQSGTMTYDSAGNLMTDTYSGGGARTYDAENRMTSATESNSTYSYDSDGHRVKRNINAIETWQVYGLGGELLAEYAAYASPLSPQKEYGYRNGELLVTLTSTAGDAHWLVTDELGTPRMIADQTGSLSGVSRHDYLPFGEELFAGTSGRTTAQGYSAGDGVRQHFTLKERDNETGLDYFGARYYASTQGRFTSPDPLLASAKRINPQTWNRYSYGNNNPLRFTDPSGEDSEDETGDVYLRTTTKTTEITVQERGGGKIVQQAKVTVTESQDEYVTDKGTVIQTEPIVTTATAVNTGSGARDYSQSQLDTMANVAKNVVEVSRDKGFDATIALGIARTETHMGTLQSQESSPAKQSDVNPMQLSGTSGIKPTTDLKSNIAGAIDVYNRGATSDLKQSLETYNNQAGKAAYATTAMGHIEQIRGSVQTKVGIGNFSQRPARVGFVPPRPE